MSESHLEQHFETDRHRILVESLSHVSMEQNQLEAYRCSEAVVFNYVHANLLTILTNRKDVGTGFHRHDEDTQYENGDGCSDESEIESGTLGRAFTSQQEPFT